MNAENKHWIESDDTAKQRIDQARTLRTPTQTGGLKFEAYLPPDLALWVLDMVERGIFIDPSEAVFVLLGEAKDIEPHDDLKREILKRRIKQGIESSEEGRTYTMAEVKAHLDELAKIRTMPAVWRKIEQPTCPE